jgi:hypothetical protein
MLVRANNDAGSTYTFEIDLSAFGEEAASSQIATERPSLCVRELVARFGCFLVPPWLPSSFPSSFPSSLQLPRSLNRPCVGRICLSLQGTHEAEYCLKKLWPNQAKIASDKGSHTLFGLSDPSRWGASISDSIYALNMDGPALQIQRRS